jgi:hypothetical protein
MPDARPFVLGLAASLALFAPLVFASPARAADAYDDAFDTAAALAGSGQLDTAAAILEAALPWYPQDYALPLQIAWLHRRAGRPAKAARFYRIALERSPSAFDARLGLALLLVQQKRCDEARSTLQALAAERPDSAAAREGLAACTPPPSWRTTVAAALSGTVSPGHPYKSLAGGVTAGLGSAHRSGFFFDATYRYTHFAPAAAATTLSAWDQHEGYASLGYSVPAGGFGVHYAAVNDGSGVLGLSHHVGISARWSPLGDVELRASASFYPDLPVLRAEPSWRIPIAYGLSIRPGLAVADAGGTVLVNGLATLSLDQPRFGLWAGGKYGDEVRPVLFAVPVVYDVTERITYGAWAGARVNASDDVSIHVSYAMDRLEQADGTATSAHTLSLGAAAAF